MRCDELREISGSFLAFFTSPCLCSSEEEALLSPLPAALQIARPWFAPQSKPAELHHPPSRRLKSHPGCILHLILLPGCPARCAQWWHCQGQSNFSSFSKRLWCAVGDGSLVEMITNTTMRRFSFWGNIACHFQRELWGKLSCV